MVLEVNLRNLRYINARAALASIIRLLATPKHLYRAQAGTPNMTKPRDIVLIVDDDLAVRESLKFALELEGLAVGVCGSGADLLRHPDLLRAGCLVLDYKMPEMDGFEVLDRLAALSVPVPVILITPNAAAPVRRRAKAAGVRHVLEKPLSDSALRDSISDVLANPAFVAE